MENTIHQQDLIMPIKDNDQEYEKEFESTIRSIQYVADGIMLQGIHDNKVRTEYRNEIKKMSDGFRNEVFAGKMTWQEAAKQASNARNELLKLSRDKTWPIGLSIAKKLKSNGLEFSDLQNKYANKLYKSNSNSLRSQVKMDAVHAKIVIKAGVSNSAVDSRLLVFSKCARGFIAISLAISAYNIWTAENKVNATLKEGSMMAAGFAGSMAGGAAGLTCGPGAVVCVPVGAFIGGFMAAFGVDYFWK
ncbi:hypothetical protein [Snodgrassella alvi]|nr:hypothetical protein [Snodgrassella alvi]